jgi:dipeptidyl aminopeptidase/acylaminoacyl peptidase
MSLLIRFSVALFAMLALPLATSAADPVTGEAEDQPTEPRRLAVDDYFRLREVDDPRISPEGEWIAYRVTTRDLEEDESNGRLWMAPTNGGRPVPLTAEGSSASRPRWSPDGKYLAFRSARDEGKIQVWTLFRQGGEAVQLTDTAQDVKAFEWSPDGKRMVIVLQDPTPQELEEKERADSGKEKEEKTPPPWVVDRRQFKQDYVGYLDRRRTHLYLLDVETKELTQITSGDFDDTQPVWSPDGKRIAFVSNRTADPDANYNTDIWVVAADNSDRGETLLQVTTNAGPDRAPAWSPDGSSIAYISDTDTDAIVYATNHLSISPSKGGEAKVLTEEVDRMISSPRFSADAQSIYFLLEDSGERVVARIAATGGAVERIVAGPHAADAFDLRKDDAVAVLISSPHLPPEVFLFDGQKLERLTHTNDEVLSEIVLGEVENVQFESGDGTEIEGFVVKPPDFDPSRRYPAILWIHGGPVSQYDFRFDYRAQLLAANGYVVVLPNPRGSSGYGQEFSLGIWQRWGEPDFEDVMAAVDYVIEQGYVDPQQLGVGGWSYGGMLTNHVITRTDRFKAAITGASATLYVANYGHDQYQRWWEYELGLPWENRELWEKLSPFNRVDRVVTPTLIVGGEKDWNVPIVNSEQLYIALKRLGRTTELVVYPGEYHGIDTPSHTKDLYQRYLDWYGKYVKGIEALEAEQEKGP